MCCCFALSFSDFLVGSARQPLFSVMLFRSIYLSIYPSIYLSMYVFPQIFAAKNGRATG